MIISASFTCSLGVFLLFSLYYCRFIHSLSMSLGHAEEHSHWPCGQVALTIGSDWIGDPCWETQWAEKGGWSDHWDAAAGSLCQWPLSQQGEKTHTCAQLLSCDSRMLLPWCNHNSIIPNPKTISWFHSDFPFLRHFCNYFSPAGPKVIVFTQLSLQRATDMVHHINYGHVPFAFDNQKVSQCFVLILYNILIILSFD